MRLSEDEQTGPACQRDRVDEHVRAAVGDGRAGEEEGQPVEQRGEAAIGLRGRQPLAEDDELGEQVEQRVAFDVRVRHGRDRARGG